MTAQQIAGPPVHIEVTQGTDEWLEARRGMLTASEVERIITPTLKVAQNGQSRKHVYAIAAQRITGYVEPSYFSDAMLRGHEDEVAARASYSRHYAPVDEAGLLVRDFGDFRLGYSPDGLVGTDGLIECKSRAQAFHVQTIAGGEMPPDFLIQVQSGLLVSARQWCDFISYCGGMPMGVFRVFPDEGVQAAIIDAARAFEAQVAETIAKYSRNVTLRGFIPTERRVVEEMII